MLRSIWTTEIAQHQNASANDNPRCPRWRIGLALAALVITVGCNTPAGMAWRQRIVPPRIFRSETVEYQRSEAQQFDPYPQDELGPSVVGGRPPDFQEPPADPSRGRWMRWPSAAPAPP
jgi:hypothetical protein